MTDSSPLYTQIATINSTPPAATDVLVAGAAVVYALIAKSPKSIRPILTQYALWIEEGNEDAYVVAQILAKGAQT